MAVLVEWEINMAQQDIVGNLFGVTPQMYEQSQSDRARQQALQYAQLDPQQQTQFALYSAGQNIPKAVGGLLGVEDPQMQLISRTNQLVQEIGIDTPEKLKRLASEVQKLPGGAPLAAQAIAQANKMLESAATVQSKTREQFSGFGKLIKERDAIAAINPDDPRIKDYDKAIAAEGTGKGTVLNIDQKGKSAFAEGLGSKDSARVAKAEELIQSASNELQTLKKMSETDRLGVISGTGATARVEALKFLDTAGFTTPQEKTKLAASENFDKLTGDLILSRIKQLGTNPSNADREFIAKIVPQLASSPLARKQLIDYMATRANEVITEASALSDYGRKNDGLGGYKPKIPLIGATNAKKDISEYTIEELEALRKTAKPGAK